MNNIKKVSSEEIAGGFAGKTTMAYLVEAEANSVVLNAVLQIVNKLLEILYIGNLQDLGVINVGLGGLLKIQLWQMEDTGSDAAWTGDQRCAESGRPK